MRAPRVVCCGEALIDLLGTDPGGRSWRAVPGGSPYNAAIAASRLGAPTSFLGVHSEDRFGQMLIERLDASNVDHRHCVVTREPTTLALVDAASVDGEPTYTFHVAGTTTVSGRVTELHLPADVGVLHVSGSVSLVLEPAASRIESLLVAAQHRAVVHLDPNPRPALVERGRFLARLDRWLGLADIVKVSRADLEWIAPGEDPVDVASRWIAGGDDDGERPLAVVVTMGGEGAVAVTGTGRVEVQAAPVDVADTVGAGDTFVGAMLAALAAHRVSSRTELAALGPGWWHTALTYAVEAAAITCSRVGADPPWRDELH